MKRNAIGRIIVYTVLSLVLTCILIAEIGTDFFFQTNVGGMVEDSAHYDATKVKSLEINWAGGYVTVYVDDQIDHILIQQSKPEDKNEAMYCALSSGTLRIDYSKRLFHIGTLPKRDLVIHVPKDWFCESLEINGAGLHINLTNNVRLGSVDINGAGCHLYLQGAAENMQINGANCDAKLEYTDRPQKLDVDGMGCVLSLVLPKECGFQVDTNGLGCDFHSDLNGISQNGTYVYGDQFCKLQINGLDCKVTISETPSE